jgi:hypothetical protein
MANPLFSIDTLPTTSAAAIREFDERYLASLGAAVPTGWADTLGALVPSRAPQLTFPVSQLNTKFRRTQDKAGRTKTLGEAEIDLKVEEFDDGYEARLKDLFEQVFAYKRWQEAGGRLVTAEEQHRHTEIAALLTAGATEACYDGEFFFDTDHPANIDNAALGTWSNISAANRNPATLAEIETEVTAMMGVLDENGEPMGVQPDTMLLPISQFEAAKNFQKQSMIASTAGTASVDNPYMNGFNIIPVKEFGLASLDWYLLDSKLLGELAPWISLRQDVPMDLLMRRYDENSDYFKDSGKIKMVAHIWYGFSLAIPHAIRKVTGV